MPDANTPPAPGSIPPPPPPPMPPAAPETAVPANQPASPPPPPAPQPASPAAPNAAAPINVPKVGFIKEEPPPFEASQDEKLWGLLSVLLGLVGAVLGLIIQGQSRFVKFYALQTLFVCVAMIPVSMVFVGACFLLVFIPFLGGIFAGLLSMTFSVALFAIMILVAIKAFNGMIAKLPLVGDMAFRHAYGDGAAGTPKT